MIVKVQLALESNIPGFTVGTKCLIYNKDRSIRYEADTPDVVKKIMNGAPKAFFYALKDKSGVLEIGAKAPWQNW